MNIPPGAADSLPPPPSTIRSTEVVLPSRVEPSGLLIKHRQLPPPTRGRLTVRMEATGVSFAEQQMRRGKYFNQPAFPFVPGYDLVGIVEHVGPEVDTSLVGARVAAITKTGAWATMVTLDARDVIRVMGDSDPVEVETMILNGITAWQMLHRTASVRAGQTVVVLGANGGVGSTLVQLARQAGVTVIGTAAERHHGFLRELGAVPVDYNRPDFAEQLSALAPDGVDAVFDHIGGAGLRDSWRLLRRGGTLVSYGTAATKNDKGNSQLPVLLQFGRLLAWNLLPNTRHAHFYNFWAGKRRSEIFQKRLRDDLGAVLELLEAGEISAVVAARIPLVEVSRAMDLAESHTVTGKVILTP